MDARFTAIEGKTERRVELSWQILFSRAVQALLPMMAAFVLTRVTLFGDYAPLAVSFVAAFGKKNGYMAFIGAILGYATLSPNGDGIKYIAATILCFAAYWIFKQFEFSKYKIFVPLLTAISLASVGFVFLTDRGINPKTVTLFACEIVIAACASWFYKDGIQAISEGGTSTRPFGNIGTTVLIFSVLCCFSGFNIMGIISVVRILGSVYVMYRSKNDGGAIGSATGLATGTVMDALNGGTPFFSVVYSVAGLIGGIFSVRGKFVFVILFILTGTAASVWVDTTNLQVPFLYENFISSIIFIILPYKMSNATEIKEISAKSMPVSQKMASARKFAADKLSGISEAFYEIQQTFSDKLDEMTHKNIEDTRIIFDSAANSVCKNCKIRQSCWECEYVATYNALNDTCRAISKNGKAVAGDFPSYFAERCLHFSDFILAVNQSAKELAIKRRRKIDVAQKAGQEICNQYLGVSEILRTVSDEMKSFPACCPFEEKVVKTLVSKYETACKVSVMQSMAGRMCIEICGKDLSKLISNSKAFQRDINRQLGGAFEISGKICTAEEQILTLKEAERIDVAVGVGVKSKNNANVSGDTGIYFKTDDGYMFLLLSDGMGTGSEASEESRMSIRLLEKLLRNGISMEEAFKVISPILSVRSQNGYGFATLDILKVDLFNGNCEMLKCGAAQSYLSLHGHTSRVDCTALPPGMAEEENKPDIIKTKVSGGDFIVMVSDGIVGEGSDSWVFQKISQYDGCNPKELAGEILNGALNDKNANDDMTVIVLNVKTKII